MVRAFWSGSAASLLATSTTRIVEQLAAAQIRHFRTNEVQQLRAWEHSIDLLRATLVFGPQSQAWWVLLEYPMLRLGKRADAIVLVPHAILVLEFKTSADRFDRSACEQVDDYGLDLHDFHAGCRGRQIVPVLVATRALPPTATFPLLLGIGVAEVFCTNEASLGASLERLARSTPHVGAPIDPLAWEAAPYRPVPTIVEAACMLFGRHGVAEIAAARADTHNLSRTTDALLSAIAEARQAEQRIILFVTGIPGAGKTLCGLNAAFGAAEGARAIFLTGNPTLVHVLREALARDAIERGQERRTARQQMEASIQALPRFRDHYVPTDEIPAEQVIVIDEAQRCWARDYAIRKSVDRPVRLTDSEPGHLLDIAARHSGFSAMICLVGSGQEIHDGEGGLAEWGAALRARPGWSVVASPDLLHATDPRQRLGDLPNLRIVHDLHLTVPVRQIRSDRASSWVDRVLAGDASGAAEIAFQAGGVPFQLTRSVAAMRAGLRAQTRGTRRCGLLASSGGKRLRAEGLGVELPHMDAQAVARWFLDHYPADVRASDALELVATEFSCQGLELDFAGVCWDGDLVRVAGQVAWQIRSFIGTRWTLPRGAEAIANQVNTYRVLLTRARYETILFVPAGDAGDPTRRPEVYDGIADFLTTCGVGPLAAAEPIISVDDVVPLLL